MTALAADAVVVFHLLFIVFALLGGALVVWRRRVAWLHLPALAWAAWIEITGGICPLTPLENHLRERAGETGYAGGFVEHYVEPVIYPPELVAADQHAIATILVSMNVLLYFWAFLRHRRRAAA